VLVEPGSNGNHFLDNDITHGGDGVFVRAINRWVSTATCLSETMPRTPIITASKPSRPATPADG
jgi:hypothetical protein